MVSCFDWRTILSDPASWLIYCDWLEDQGVEAGLLRQDCQEGQSGYSDGYGRGCTYEDGCGYGNASGAGYGYGYGSYVGSGYGSGYGHRDGSGAGYEAY